MADFRFTQVDVFADEAFRGNPVAVVHDAQGLSDDALLTLARWTNLSETTFLLPPTDPRADYRLRIFTPGGELPFAGHPTLGSAHAWLAAGGRPATPGRVVQQCGIGLVSLRHEAILAFAAPPLLRSGAPDAATLTTATNVLGIATDEVIAASWVDNGPEWLALRLADPATVLSLRPDFGAMAAAGLKLGVCALYPAGGASDLEVRAFAPDGGVPEDPVTGSLNAGLARWLIHEGTLPPRYVATQGAALGRAGRVVVDSDRDAIWVGGTTTIRVTGTLCA